ncbi:ubiquitin carboxyl-terminal hydrolase 36-like [Strongylocentrotus purpuratus]|uniref:Uncharacterized protein n=1 Tax=Strongylocentrotus purpuratus TaxID=7668 RepID=A0A7M7LKV5_STRPU|nr:ubiquitin carboxyl-terminal hydrolase 36-like [Strongylocentrotus purpuratus]
MVEQRIKQTVISKMESSHMEAPLSYYQLRKRAATWLRCGTLSSLILTLAGVAMIILGIQGTPASYNIKWIGIAASASGGSLLLLLLLISLIMASFCPQEGGGSIQVQGLPPPCTPSHHHMHSHQHAVPSGSGALTPTSRHPPAMDGMQWMVYYHPSKHQQLEHSILYPIPGFNHGISSSVGGSNGVHNGGQWAWRAHNTTIQPPPQYSSLYPDPNGNCIGLTTNPNCNLNANNVASTAGGSAREGQAATTPTSTAAATSPSEQRTLQRPQRLTPPLLLRCSPSSDRHVHHHHHTHFRQGTRCPSPSPSSQSCRTPTPGEHRSTSTSPGQQSFGQSFAQQAVRGSPTTPQNPQPRKASPQDNHACRQHQLSSPSSQQMHLFHPQHPLNLPLKQSPLTGASQLPSTSRRSFHSSLPSTPLLESVDETRNTSDCV